MKGIDFQPTNYFNDLLALFHLNDGECEVIPAKFVIDPETKQIEIDQDISFLRFMCGSVEEAQRRAYIIAALTYDIHLGLFVKVATAEMLRDPFILESIN